MPFTPPSISLRHAPFHQRSMAYYTLRRTCPPGTRIVRRGISGNNSASTSTTNTSPSSSFHTSARYAYPQKDTQDKDSLKPRSTEYSKSGSDDAAASGTAFDPNQTKPETEKKNEDENELEVSPANTKVSGQRPAQEGGADHAPEHNRERTSGGGSAPKNGGGRSG